MEDESVVINFNSLMAPTLTTEQEINGAIAAFYPGVLERLHRMIGGDFYLVFSSISDTHIHPINGRFKVSSMRKSLAEMNRDMNQQGELLTRKIYRYEGERE